MEQIKLFDDEPYRVSNVGEDKLYNLICQELQTNDGMSSSEAHLAATDIAEKIRQSGLACSCAGNCGCRR